MMIISWSQIKEILENDGVVALPTDTVYGLAANALSEKAVEKIYQLKGRNFNKPLVWMFGNVRQVKENVVDWSMEIELLAEKHWPGPLTMIFKKKNGGTIGIRIPDHAGLLDLLNPLDFPLAVTSANRAGEPEINDAEQIGKVFNNMIDGIIVDEKNSSSNVPSTVLDVSGDEWKILREGPLKLI
jgi:L-threonylcarbamoyladenylate synthase